jgi:hypothetical protein
MPISLQTNFDVFSNYPIDSRLVTTNSTTRLAIDYKYEGLKVYDKSDQITYVWNGITYSIDGTNIGGIYGGSGTIPSDIEIYTGRVSQNIDVLPLQTSNDQISSTPTRGRKISKGVSSSTSGDQVFVDEYFYRKTNGDNTWSGLSYRIEQMFKPLSTTNVNSYLQGPFIEFNGLVPNAHGQTGALVLGAPSGFQRGQPTQGGPNGYGPRLVLAPNNYFGFYASLNPVVWNGVVSGGIYISQEVPITISRYNSQSYLGYNFAPITQTTPTTSPTANIFSQTRNAYRIKFGDGTENNLTIETKLKATGNANPLSDTFYPFTEVMRIDNVDTASMVYSPVKFRVETSGRDWDNSSTRNYQLLSIEEILRTTENRFTKLQMWNQGTINGISGTILYLNSDGNSYTVTLTANQSISDIKLRKASLVLDFPTGSIITIKFINQDPVQPGWLVVNTGLIYSDITDGIFVGNNESRLTIDYKPTDGYEAGDIITFRRTGTSWDIVTANRLRRLTTRKGGSGSATTWTFKPLTYLDKFTSDGRFSSLNSSSVGHLTSASIGNHPSRFNYSESSIGVSKDTTNLEEFKLKFNVDGNKMVHVQGNFRITLQGIQSTPGEDFITQGSGQTLFWTQQNRENIFRVAEFTSQELKPHMDNIFCPVVMYGENQLYFEDAFISISKPGSIFLSFKLKTSKTITKASDYVIPDGTKIDVWVPPFSYTAVFGNVVS